MSKHVTYLPELHEIYLSQYLSAYNDLNPWCYSRKQRNNKGLFNKTYRKLLAIERQHNRFFGLGN